MGCSPIHKGYRCFEPSTNRVYISRHVVFDESIFPYAPKKEHVLQGKTEFVSYPEADAWIEEEKIIMEKANLDPIKKGKEKISQGFNQCCEDIVTESAPTPPTHTSCWKVGLEAPGSV